jgi:hypothetical protein
MSGHRQAALALYPLGPADQELILAELPDADQARLRGYLAELTELGFDGAAPGLPAAPAPAPTPLPSSSEAGRATASAREQVRAAPAAAMAALLANEPAGLVAQLMASDTWPWHADLLALLEPARRALVQRALEARRARDPAPACAAVLLEALGPRVAACSAAAPRPKIVQLFARARAWTR